MSPAVYFLTIALLLTTAIIVFAMKYASSFAASRARIAEESERGKIAETHAAELAKITEALSKISADMAGQSRAISSIETVLKQVG